MKTALIIGTGPVGMTVMDELLKVKQRIIMVNRSGILQEEKDAAVKVISCDISDSEMLSGLVDQVDDVYMCAVPAYHRWVDEYEPMMHSLVNAFRAKGKKLIVCDNLYMYGEPDKEGISESSKMLATTRKGIARKKGAQILLNAHSENVFDLKIARGSDFYGPRVNQSAFGKAYFESIIRGKKAMVLGSVDKLHSITYIKDFARTLVAIANDDRATEIVYHVPNSEVSTPRAFARRIGDAVDRKAKLQIMSPFAMRILGTFIPALKEMIEMQYQWDKDFVVDDTRIRQQLGIEATPFNEAISETIAYYLKQA